MQQYTEPSETSLTSSLIGKCLVPVYDNLPKKILILNQLTKLEGGQLYSGTLRSILDRYYGVSVGPYSYGSLLAPGMADRGLEIGSYVSIGDQVRRYSAAHPLDDLSLHPFWYNASLGFTGPSNDVERTSCWIGHDSWVGSGSVILPKCSRIGIGSVIGAGSVVTSNVDDFAIVAGNPARPIGMRLDRDRRSRLLKAQPWLLPPERAKIALREISSSIDDLENS